MNEDQYILSFDLGDITQNISELQATYSLLNEEIKRSSESSSDLIDRVGNKLDSISVKLNSSLQSMGVFYSNITAQFANMLSTFKDLDKYSDSIAKNLKEIGGVDISGFAAAQQETVEERLAAVSPGSAVSLSLGVSSDEEEGAKKALDIANKAVSAAKKAIEDAEKAETFLEKSVAKVKGAAQREASGAIGAVGGMVRGAGASVGLQQMGGGPLSVLSGLASLIFLGVQYDQRIGAERGEMVNAAEAAGGILETSVQKGISEMAKFAEHAQWQFGIARKEVQGIVNQLSNLGIQLDETITGIYESDTQFKDVTKNVITLSLAIDKNLNIAAGTSMQRAIQLMEDYGYSIDSAVDKVKNLSMAAKTSGMDIQRFINSVMESSATLVQYQIDAEDVEQVMSSIKSRYEEMGIDPRRAGAMAGQVTQGLAGSVMNLPEGVEMAVAKQLFPDIQDAVAARVKMKERFLNVKSPEDRHNFFIEYINALRDVIVRPGMDRDKAIVALEKITGNFQQAQAIYDYGPSLASAKKGGRVAEGSLKELKKAFETEGQTLTDLYKTQKELVKHLAEMGAGALKLITGIHNVLVVGIKNIIAMIGSLGITDPEKREQVMDEISAMSARQFDLMSEGALQMFEGGSKAFKSLAPMFDELSGKVREVYEYDPGGYLSTIFDEIGRLDNKIDVMLERGDAVIHRAEAAVWEILSDLPFVDPSTKQDYIQRAASLRTFADEEVAAAEGALAREARKVERGRKPSEAMLGIPSPDTAKNWAATVDFVLPNPVLRQAIKKAQEEEISE